MAENLIRLPEGSQPVSQAIAGAERAVATIKSPDQAQSAKIMVTALKRLFEKEGLFDQAFGASKLYIQADRKLFDLISKSGLTYADLAKELSSTESAIKVLVHDLRRAYGRPESEIKSLIQKAYAKREYLTRKWFIASGQGSFNTGSFEWYTPAWVYERARHVMGSIDLDPASSAQAQAFGNTSARYFTKENNALERDWGDCGNVFCNPPYTVGGKSGATLFLKKFLNSDFKQGIWVVLEDSGTQYGQFFWSLANAVFIPKGRLHFVFQGKEKGTSTTRSTLVFGISVNVLKFWLAFKAHGQVITPYHKVNQLRMLYNATQGGLTDWLAKLYTLPKP